MLSFTFSQMLTDNMLKQGAIILSIFGIGSKLSYLSFFKMRNFLVERFPLLKLFNEYSHVYICYISLTVSICCASTSISCLNVPVFEVLIFEFLLRINLHFQLDF
jgi:hypothetical protein